MRYVCVLLLSISLWACQTQAPPANPEAAPQSAAEPAGDAILLDSAETLSAGSEDSTEPVSADPNALPGTAADSATAPQRIGSAQLPLRGFVGAENSGLTNGAQQLPGFAAVACQRSAGAEACGDEMWCEPAAGQCEVSVGVCQPIAEICTQDYRPVCGCDGKTYSNSCARQRAQVGEAYSGECGRD